LPLKIKSADLPCFTVRNISKCGYTNARQIICPEGYCWCQLSDSSGNNCLMQCKSQQSTWIRPSFRSNWRSCGGCHGLPYLMDADLARPAISWTGCRWSAGGLCLRHHLQQMIPRTSDSLKIRWFASEAEIRKISMIDFVAFQMCYKIFHISNTVRHRRSKAMPNEIPCALCKHFELFSYHCWLAARNDCNHKFDLLMPCSYNHRLR
jgi:hypothetical protein